MPLHKQSEDNPVGGYSVFSRYTCTRKDDSLAATDN
jgi:hypothetical protein